MNGRFEPADNPAGLSRPRPTATNWSSRRSRLRGRPPRFCVPSAAIDSFSGQRRRSPSARKGTVTDRSGTPRKTAPKFRCSSWGDEMYSRADHPAIITSYGGHGVSMTPQFSVFVAYLVERGCLFALPNIRGGSEFGADWHTPANGEADRPPTTISSRPLNGSSHGRTTADRLAIFGGSNSGLLVGAALTQRPEMFRAVVCMVPMLDMLRYHLFDKRSLARRVRHRQDPEDFAALIRPIPPTTRSSRHRLPGDADRVRRRGPHLQSATRPENDRAVASLDFLRTPSCSTTAFFEDIRRCSR